MICVLDYGCGNLGSIVNMLQRSGHAARTITSPDDVLQAEKIILPGVGAFDAGISHLRDGGFVQALEQRVLRDGVPLLGLCLGMHLLLEASEEGELAGLGWVPGRVVRFRRAAGSRLRVLHMGWSGVRPVPGAALFEGFDREPRFYFAHGFYVQGVPKPWASAHATHGEPFVCALEQSNIFATQFHPEKSHRYGIELLQRFAGISPCPSPA